jgi:hypothetical protein
VIFRKYDVKDGLVSVTDPEDRRSEIHHSERNLPLLSLANVLSGRAHGLSFEEHSDDPGPRSEGAESKVFAERKVRSRMWGLRHAIDVVFQLIQPSLHTPKSNTPAH